MADIQVYGLESWFNEDARFYKDVYIYGTLYYNIAKGTGGENSKLVLNNLDVLGTSNFFGPANFYDDVYIADSSTITVGILTVRKRLDVGVGGTTLRANADIGKVGIANTNPTKELDVTGSAIISNRVGIGSTEPEQKLDIAGSVKIDEFIYDSANSPGINGYYLNMDAGGVRWVSATPNFSEGIFIQDEGTYIPITGTARSFTALNFKQINSLGLGTDNIIPIPNPSNPTFIADIQSKDLWGFNESGEIYRMTNVGIQNNNPVTTLDISGTLHTTGAVDFDSTLNVDGDVTFTSVTQSTDKDTGALIVEGGVGIEKNINIGGAAKVLSTTSSTTKDTGALIVEGGVGIEENLNVGGAAKVLSTTQSTDKDTGALIVEGGVGIEKNTNIGGVAKVFDTTQSTDKDTGALIVEGGVGVEKNINIGGVAKVFDTTQSTDKDTGALIVEGGVGIEENLNVGGAAKVLSTTSSTTKDTGALIVEGGVGIEENLNVGSTLKVGIAGTVITTTGIGSVGFGTNSPQRDIQFKEKDVFFDGGAIYDTNENVGFKSEQYQVPRNVLTTVGVDTAGSIIGGRFFDAANLIRLNLDFIANEAIGFLTSTDYKNPSFVIVDSLGNPTDPVNCKDDIKDILKAITYDITRGGNSQSVGAGLSYYNGPSLIHITGTDTNGYSVKDATIVAITTAAQLARYVINNVSLPKSYQSVGSSVPQIKDLTLADDPIVGFNTNYNGCSNVVSAITVCAGIVTTIIGGGPTAAPKTTYPDGKIVWSPAGADSKNIIYVSKYGNDDNNGRTEGSAKLTIGAAAAVAQPGDTIMVRSGIYYENNPIGLRTDVTVTGQDLRLVTICPQNNDDVFYVRRGCLIENLNFAYSKNPFDEDAPIQITGAALAFPPPAGIGSAKSGYLHPGPATEGPTGRWRSPYVRNCTNFMSGSTGMKIDGNHATASTIGNDLKCMVCDSFTQYNENGIGVSITNNGYAQLVSIFTINCDIAIYAASGGSCDLTNSNSSFGNFGLVAVGLGSTEFTGIVSSYPPTRTQLGVDAGSDTVTFANVKDNFNNVRRPYDGQALFFKIDLNNYPDAVKTGLSTTVLQEPMVQIQSIIVTNGGSGFSPATPPTVVIRDSDDLTLQPKGPQGIIAEVSPTIDEITGSITAIDVINSGRNYLPTQNLEVFIDGGDLVGAAATVITQSIYYTVDSATETTPVTGITTITFNEFIPYELFGNEEVSLKRISRILTSSHSFEYIGTGTSINTATPFQGAVPIKANEVVALDGAQIPFTSTDQKGNFDIGEGFQVNQPTATVRGRDFSKAIQAEVTPLILALR